MCIAMCVCVCVCVCVQPSAGSWLRVNSFGMTVPVFLVFVYVRCSCGASDHLPVPQCLAQALRQRSSHRLDICLKLQKDHDCVSA